ncbi:MAG: DUF1998 domain-containing protein, partial [Candidatus Lokiarchaeota archaeon]|nr:DUF1998 domain-containing protein [Candidatus Lokiarchaeota archaeon]
YLKCPKCHRTYFFEEYHSCSRRNCPQLLSQNVENNNFYLNLYRKLPEKESEVNAKEHSAQVEGSAREDFERSFQSNDINSINVLVCTPTMELGIDIGELSAILMRNVPPDPSRYAQRAGRAGRKNQPSIVSVFCGTGYAKGPHDQYFYQQPERIVSGKISPPNFLLDNKKLIKKHIYAAIIESLSLKFPQKIGELLDLDKKEEGLPFYESVEQSLKSEIDTNRELLEKIIKTIFSQEIREFEWFTEEYIKSKISSFYTELDRVLDNFRDRYLEILSELRYLYEKSISSKGMDQKDRREQQALQRKLQDMQNGKQPFDTFGFLRNYGFLPNYGFPSDNTLLTMYDQNRSVYHDNWRSTVIAIREFAPYNQIYFLGSKYNVNKAIVKADRGQIDVDKIYICENCNEILIDTPNLHATTLTKCPNCEEEITLSSFKSSIHFPHMYSISRSRITCDEENRQVKGYEITMNYKHGGTNLDNFKIECGEIVLGTISYEHNGKIFMVNKGTNVKSQDGNKIELKAFSFCSACGKWLSERKLEDHLEKCPKNAAERNIYRNLWLFVEGNHDVVVFNLPIVGEVDIESYYTTLKETIFQSLILTYNLDESEIETFINPVLGKEEQSIVVFETEEGGTGILKSLLNPSTVDFEKFTGNMLRILHHKTHEPYDETIEACVKACYNCLLRFRNQFQHEYLDRKLVVPLVKKMVKCNISKVTIGSESGSNGSEAIGLDDDARLEMLKERCDSGLEKMVLDSIIELKLPLPKEAQKTYFEDDNPITKADFYYVRDKNEIYVFIDGPPHTPDHIQQEDIEKRAKIESKGYSVVELDFKDGKYQEDSSLIEKELKSKLIPYLID